jgi:hypothetical protein
MFRFLAVNRRKTMAIHDGRWAIASLAAIAVSLIANNTAHAAPVHGISASAIAETSLVEKSVIIHRALVGTVVGGNGRALASRAVYADGTLGDLEKSRLGECSNQSPAIDLLPDSGRDLAERGLANRPECQHG